MKVVRRIAELDPSWPKPVVLVPTMGAFHEGHLSLIRRAKELGRTVVVSLFVNPTQFGRGEDFEQYPRDEARDFELAEALGVDVMFAPTVDEMYASVGTFIHVGEVSDRWEGAFRPGHFDGVATVVAKLFNVADPDVALFGLKDFQQCAVLSRLVEDLNIRVKLVFGETVREPDGLALSSRNRYLSESDRKKAPCFYRALGCLAGVIAKSPSKEVIEASLHGATEKLTKNGFQVDYIELVDARTLEPVRSLGGPVRIIGAARLGTTRLIDNVAI